MSAPLRVVVADDQAIVREGLATLLGVLDEVEVVGVAADGEQAVALALELTPDVVLMDLRMPRCDGVEATARIREARPAVEIVVLTTYADDASVIGALRAGARGYLTKDAGTAEILRAIEAAAAGQALLDPGVQARLLDAASAGASRTREDGEAGGRPSAPGATVAGSGPRPAESAATTPLPDELTPREAEVLRLIARGLANREIAATLVVSEATVKTHVNHLFAKTGARDRAQAVRYAYEHGLVGG